MPRVIDPSTESRWPSSSLPRCFLPSFTLPSSIPHDFYLPSVVVYLRFAFTRARATFARYSRTHIESLMEERRQVAFRKYPVPLAVFADVAAGAVHAVLRVYASSYAMARL